MRPTISISSAMSLLSDGSVLKRYFCVVVEEPRAVEQALDSLLHVAGIVAWGEDAEQRLLWIRAGRDALHDAVKEDRRAEAPRVRRATRLDQGPIHAGRMSGRTLERGDDVSLDDLLILRALQAGGQLVDNVIDPEVKVVRVDEPGVPRLLLPQTSHDRGEQAQRTTRALEVGIVEVLRFSVVMSSGENG